MFGKNDKAGKNEPKYPGIRMAVDGNTAVIMCEREASDAAGAYPITPSTQMGEFWAEEVARGHRNVSGRPLVFIEPESEHAAAGVTAGMSMSGLRATNFSSAQGVAFMHESLYAAAGKRLPYVLNIGARAITKASLNVHCGHDDYHCVDDTGFMQFFACNAQAAADLNLIARKTAELSLTPAIVAQDGFLTTHLIEPVNIPERELIEEFLGHPGDEIECPTPAQRMIYGKTRRRVPLLWDVDNPVTSGVVQNQDSFMQTVAAQRPFFFDHVREIAEQVMAEYAALTGREYGRVNLHSVEDADYVVIGQGSMIPQAVAIAEYLRKTRKLKVGVIDLVMFRPFPGDLISKALLGKKGVAVLERTDQPLAEDLPMTREVRAALAKALENGQAGKGGRPWPDYGVARRIGDIPPVHSGAYGLGSRDLQPEAIIGAVENMLPDGPRRKFFYLGIDFIHKVPASPREEVRQQKLLEAYPHIGELAVHGSENPDLLPEGAITVRMHSVGGWGAITTGKNLAMTLHELLGYEIKANPKYGSEKKGQPTTYYMSAAPETIPLTCEYHHVDVVLSPDPNVFEHSNPLFGLRKGGVFIIQHGGTAEELWESLPESARRTIIDNDIRLFYVDGFRIARDEASNPELQLRMQGNAFQGAFFAASPLMERAGLDEKKLFAAIEEQLRAKFGSKGKKVVEDNLRVVRRGFDETREVTDKPLGSGRAAIARKESTLPVMLTTLPEGDGGRADIHAFWERTGRFYAEGQGSDITADPFQALSLIPASTGVFRDMTQIRFEVPQFVAENCTACGECYTVCPDSACPGLVNTPAEVFDAAVAMAEKTTGPSRFLRRAVRAMEKKLRALVGEAGEEADVNALIHEAIGQYIAESRPAGEADAEAFDAEMEALREAIGDFRFSITKPYWSTREKKQKGSGGLFSITINPYACKGCMECVEVCGDGALIPARQDHGMVERLRKEWDFWLNLPSTGKQFERVSDLDEKIGALHTILLDKPVYESMNCGDGACLGCGEKTAIHLFTSTVTALMQPRVREHVKRLRDLIERLEIHIRLKLSEGLDLSSPAARELAGGDDDLTLADVASRLDEQGVNTLVDKEWLGWATGLLEKLRDLKWRYEAGPTNRGRREMGIVNSTGCTSVWGSTFPYNPYPFPWTSHLFQDAPSVAMGVFEGHMAKMAEGFRAVRMAELELEGKYDPAVHDEMFASFGWKDFSDEEWKLCPPVVALGGDGAMYDIGFQNLSRALASGMPVKVLVVDTQVYSNTGGQACTSGFISQVADMSPYGEAWKGKQEIRKEIALIGMAHRTSFVLQGAQSNVTHLIEGFIDGLNSRRPALFNIYAPCPPEHGIGDDVAEAQSKMAVEARAYPLMRYDPDAGETFDECLDLSGNPSPDADWPEYTLRYVDEDGKEGEMKLPFTFADFAVTEGRFRKHFKRVPRDKWNDDMVPVHEFIDMDEDERAGKFPYVWVVDGDNRLTRAVCSREIVKSTIERRAFWRQLKGVAGMLHEVDVAAEVNRARAEMAGKLAAALLELAGGGNGAPVLELAAQTGGASGGAGGAPAASAAGAAPEDYEPVWIDTPECTTCDECITIAPGIFQYDENDQAIVVDPRGGTYEQIVKAAEKCTAGCIHPGTPWDMSEKNIDKLMKRAEPFQ